MKVDDHILETFHRLPKVIIFNGPPSSGKDTLADLLAEDLLDDGYNVARLAFKDCLYLETALYYNVRPEWLIEKCNDRATKEVPHVELNDLSPRQALIHVSEGICKPLHGKEFFGKALAKAVVESGCEYAVVSDGGFMDEMPPLLDQFQVQVIRVHREGKTFDGDSRRYIDPPCKVDDVYQVEGHPEFALSYVNEVLI